MAERKRWLAITLVACGCLAAWLGSAQGACPLSGGGGISGTSNSSSTNPIYYVVAVRESDGSKMFVALDSKAMKDREKQLTSDYAEAVKAWKADNSLPKPVAPILKKLQRVKGKDSKAQAEALAAQLQQKLDEKEKAKEETEADKAS